MGGQTSRAPVTLESRGLLVLIYDYFYCYDYQAYIQRWQQSRIVLEGFSSGECNALSPRPHNDNQGECSVMHWHCHHHRCHHINYLWLIYFIFIVVTMLLCGRSIIMMTTTTQKCPPYLCSLACTDIIIITFFSFSLSLCLSLAFTILRGSALKKVML